MLGPKGDEQRNVVREANALQVGCWEYSSRPTDSCSSNSLSSADRRLAHVCAFGDDVTDAGTLARAHWGVAMGNAVPEAKAAARLHTSSDDQNGVAEFLKRRLR